MSVQFNIAVVSVNPITSGLECYIGVLLGLAFGSLVDFPRSKWSASALRSPFFVYTGHTQLSGLNLFVTQDELNISKEWPTFAIHE